MSDSTDNIKFLIGKTLLQEKVNEYAQIKELYPAHRNGFSLCLRVVDFCIERNLIPHSLKTDRVKDYMENGRGKYWQAMAESTKNLVVRFYLLNPRDFQLEESPDNLN
jgi:hypothetical protein